MANPSGPHPASCTHSLYNRTWLAASGMVVFLPPFRKWISSSTSSPLFVPRPLTGLWPGGPRREHWRHLVAKAEAATEESGFLVFSPGGEHNHHLSLDRGDS